jgi:3-methyl-2-oxobutanoate hydroxymethyltransferase
VSQAVESAVTLVKAGAEAVKLEGGVAMADTIAAITRCDIPVVGHIGLTPQSYHRMGGHRVQGRSAGYEAGGRERIIEDAAAVEAAGACAVVIEGVPHELATEITAKISIPTIGIGAGPGCSGQVLVLHDVLGLSDCRYRFAKQYAELGSIVVDAARSYVEEVRVGSWPDLDHSFS